MGTNRKRIIALFCCCTLLFSGITLDSHTANAGISELYLENTSDDSSFSSGNWIRSGNYTTISSNGVLFESTDQSFDKATLISSIQDIHSYYPEKQELVLFDANVALSFTQVSEKFALIFGLTNLLGSYGAKNSTALWFSLEAGVLYTGLSTFDSNGNERSLIEKSSLGQYDGGTVTIKLKATRRYGETNVDVLSGEVSSGSQRVNISNVTGVTATGYISFAESKKEAVTTASISKCTILTYQYRVAKNTADNKTPALADFNSGTYNTNEWYSEGRFGYFDETSVKVQDGKFRLTNAGTCSISTKFDYSNFTMSFDVSDIQKTAVGKNGTEAKAYDPKKAIKDQYDYLVSPGFYVMLGCLDYTGFSVEDAYVYFEPYTYSVAGDITANSLVDYTKNPECTRVTISTGSSIQYVVLEDNLWEVGNDKATIYLSLVDGEFTLAYSINGGSVKEVPDLNDFNMVPYGYIKLGGMGHKASLGNALDEYGIGYQLKQLNMAFDNITLYNYDALAKAIQVDYSPCSDGSGKDYQYTDQWDSKDLIG